MSLYAARKKIEAVFTVAAVNTQIDALNTLYSSSVAHIASVSSSVQSEMGNLPAASFPALLYHVAAAAPVPGEIKSQGKRDDQVNVVLTYLGKEAALANAEDAADIVAEALRPIIETLDGLQYLSTRRYVVEVMDLTSEIARFDVGGSVIRIGSRVKFTLLMRTEGL
jgi:hypothetical protein